MHPNPPDVRFSHAVFGGPDWRWRAAHGALGGAPNADGSPPDEYVEAARDYLEAVEHADHGQGAGDSPVGDAVKLWQDPAARRTVVLLCLANSPTADIARRLSVSEAAITFAERLFFDVRPRLSASDWITVNVFSPLIRQGDAERAVECRAAFWGGPGAAAVILDADPKLATEGAKRLVALEERLHLKALAAMELPLTADNASKILQATLDHQIAKQRLELAREKFKHRCDLSARRHRQVMERQEHQRADAKAASERAATSPLASLKWAKRQSPPKPSTAPSRSKQVSQDGRRLASTRQERLSRRRQNAGPVSCAVAV